MRCMERDATQLVSLKAISNYSLSYFAVIFPTNLNRCCFFLHFRHKRQNKRKAVSDFHIQ